MLMKTATLLGAMFLALAPASVLAQPGQPSGSTMGRKDDDRRGPQRAQTSNRDDRRAPAASRNDNGRNSGQSRHGNWDSKWGSRPSDPPRSWGNRSNWYQHVRACQQRYRSYNSRTDQYFVRRGVSRTCTL